MVAEVICELHWSIMHIEISNGGSHQTINIHNIVDNLRLKTMQLKLCDIL